MMLILDTLSFIRILPFYCFSEPLTAVSGKEVIAAITLVSGGKAKRRPTSSDLGRDHFGYRRLIVRIEIPFATQQ
jgi:hypothetical protein